MKQTAVEFLIDNLHYLHSTKWNDILKECKEMEKQQIIDAYEEGMCNVDGWIVNENGIEQYYNETFKQNENK